MVVTENGPTPYPASEAPHQSGHCTRLLPRYLVHSNCFVGWRLMPAAACLPSSSLLRTRPSKHKDPTDILLRSTRQRCQGLKPFNLAGQHGQSQHDPKHPEESQGPQHRPGSAKSKTSRRRGTRSSTQPAQFRHSPCSPPQPILE